MNNGQMRVSGILAAGLMLWAGAVQADDALQTATPSLWRAGIGSGFQSGAQTLTIEVGANKGLAAFGSVQAHDLVLGSISYGHMLGKMVGGDHWYHGNFEWRLEVFGGAEFSPGDEWVIGLTPHLRYNLSTGSRWVPFLDIGAGVTATGIGPPDLSNTFEFNLQGGGGVHYFLRENLALTLSVHYLHMSCAGISQPNLGLNGVTGMLGLTWLF
jgi:opacity protein-like surface antigen